MVHKATLLHTRHGEGNKVNTARVGKAVRGGQFRNHWVGRGQCGAGLVQARLQAWVGKEGQCVVVVQQATVPLQCNNTYTGVATHGYAGRQNGKGKEITNKGRAGR